MTNEKLYEILGNINEKHISEARTYQKAPKIILIKRCTIAACLCLAVACVWCVNTTDSPNTAAGGIMPGGATIGAEDLSNKNEENYGESYQEAITAQPNEIGKQNTELEYTPDTVLDEPSFEISSDLASYMEDDAFASVYGGCYLDENGNWVVWLTENTEDSRCAALARNPALPEAETIFRTANYSLAYLAELLANISEGMRDGRLPYVTDAGVMEQINRVSVTMTTDDEKAMATVSSFDTLGGAIEFQYATGNSKDDLATAN